MHFIEIVCHLRKTNVLLFFGVRLVGKARHFRRTGFFLSFFAIESSSMHFDSPVVFWRTFYHSSEQIKTDRTGAYVTELLSEVLHARFGKMRGHIVCFFPVGSCNKSLVISCKLKLSVASKPGTPTICHNNQVHQRIYLSNLVWSLMEKYQIKKYYFFTQILRERSCWRS